MPRGRPRNPTLDTVRGRIGARIRARRERLKLSVAEAAGRADVPVPTWYHWEAGTHVSLDTLILAAEALETKPGKLLEE